MGQVRAHMPLKPLLFPPLILSLFLSLHFRLACSFTHSQQAGPSLCNMITANLTSSSLLLAPSFGTPNDVEEDDDGDDGDNDDGIAH